MDPRQDAFVHRDGISRSIIAGNVPVSKWYADGPGTRLRSAILGCLEHGDEHAHLRRIEPPVDTLVRDNNAREPAAASPTGESRRDSRSISTVDFLLIEVVYRITATRTSFDRLMVYLIILATVTMPYRYFCMQATREKLFKLAADKSTGRGETRRKSLPIETSCTWARGFRRVDSSRRLLLRLVRLGRIIVLFR